MTRDNRLDDHTWLHDQYVTNELKISEVGAIVGHADGTVLAALKRAGIARRPRGGNHEIRYRQLRDIDYLIDALVRRRSSLEAAAREIGCSATVMRRAVADPNITDALIRAGWDPEGNATAAKVGRPAKVHLPDDAEIIAACSTHTTCPGCRGGVTVQDLTVRFGLNATGVRKLYPVLARLVETGALTSRGNRPRIYTATP